MFSKNPPSPLLFELLRIGSVFFLLALWGSPRLQAAAPNAFEAQVNQAIRKIERAKSAEGLNFYSDLHSEVQQNPMVLSALLEARLLGLTAPETKVAEKATALLNDSLATGLSHLMKAEEVSLHQFNSLLKQLFVAKIDKWNRSESSGPYSIRSMNKIWYQIVRSPQFATFLARIYLGESNVRTKIDFLETINRYEAEHGLRSEIEKRVPETPLNPFEKDFRESAALAILLEKLIDTAAREPGHALSSGVDLETKKKLLKAHTFVASDINLPINSRMDSLMSLESLVLEHGQELELFDSKFSYHPAIQTLARLLPTGLIPLAMDIDLTAVESFRSAISNLTEELPQLKKVMIESAHKQVLGLKNTTATHDARLVTGALLFLTETQSMPQDVARFVLSHEPKVREIVLSVMPKFSLGPQIGYHVRESRFDSFEPAMEYARIIKTAASASAYPSNVVTSLLLSTIDSVRKSERKAAMAGAPVDIKDPNQFASVFSNHLETAFQLFAGEVSRGDYKEGQLGVVDTLRALGPIGLCRLL